MAARRLPSRLSRRAKARARFGWARSERATVGLAVVALGGAGTVIAGQFSRLLRRRAPERNDHEPLIEAAPAAAVHTGGGAVPGYAAAPRSETLPLNPPAGLLRPLPLPRPCDLGDRDPC